MAYPLVRRVPLVPTSRHLLGTCISDDITAAGTQTLLATWKRNIPNAFRYPRPMALACHGAWTSQ
jgi:hypothetical protein